jgi:hypothetical protein
VHVCMYACMYVCMYACMYALTESMGYIDCDLKKVCVYIHMCLCVCVHVGMVVHV